MMMYNKSIGEIMIFGVCSNLTRDKDGVVAKKVANFLSSQGVQFFLSEELSCLNLDAKVLNIDDLAKMSDIVIVLGGDGTVLRYAKVCAKYNTAVFNVNLGHLGFLTAVETNEIEGSLLKILTGDYVKGNRYLLQVKSKNNTFYALNECVVNRGRKAKMITTELDVNGCLVDRIKSDAVIVSTPTGSTAYSLSCGGPIVSPDVKGLIITPVSPHSLHSRPLVVGYKSVVSIKLIKSGDFAHINIDGDDVEQIKDGDIVSITKSKFYATFITLNHNNFFDQLHKKLNYWSD